MANKVTNREKFREVFGFAPKDTADICDIMLCDEGCPYNNIDDCVGHLDYWDQEYVEPEAQ